jgi:hypothetical protein
LLPLEIARISATLGATKTPLRRNDIMTTAYQLIGRIVLACGVALGLGVLGALAWANSESSAETTAVVVDTVR